jgi:outer membrane protein insertion porin family
VTRARRVLAGLALLVLAAVVLFALGLFPQDAGRALLESRLQATVGPNARVGALSVRPGALRADAAGVVLDGPTYRVEIDRVRLAVSPASLWGRTLDLRDFEVDGVRLVLRPSSQAHAEAAPFAGPVIVRNLRVTNATVVYRDPVLEGDVVLRGVEARGGIGEGALEIRVGGGSWERKPPLALGPAHARLRVSPRLDVRLDSLEAGLARSRLRASGSLGRAWSPELDLRFDGALDLAEIEGLAGLAPARGVVRTEGTVRGPLAALRAEARLSTDGAVSAGWPIDAGTGRFTYDSSGPGEATLDLEAALLGGRGQAQARLSGAAVRGRVSATAIDLARLRGRTPAPDGLSGRAHAEASFEGMRPMPGVEGAVRVEATVRATGALDGGAPVRVEARTRGPVRFGAAGPRLDLEWTAILERLRDTNAETRLTAQGTARGTFPPAVDGTLDGMLTARAPRGPVPIALTGTFRSEGGATRARLEARGLGDPVAITGEWRGSVAQAVEVRAAAIDLAPLVPETSGRAHISLTASGPLDALSGAGTVTVDGLATRGVDIGSATLRLQANQGLARIELEVPAFSVTGEMEARQGPAAMLTGTVRLAGTPLAPFAVFLPEGQPLDGRLQGEIDLRVPLDEPGRASATARIESVEARSGQLSAATRGPFTLDLRDRLLTVRDLSIEGPGVTLQAAGSAGLDAPGPIDVKAQAAIDLTRLPVPHGWTVAGTARADVAVSGPRDRPQASGLVEVVGVSVSSPSLPPLALDDGRIDLEGDAIAIPGLVARVAEGSIVLSGRVPLAAVWRPARRDPTRAATAEQAQLRLTWNGIQAAALAKALRPDGAEIVDAALAGEIEVTGGLASVEEIRALARLPATTLRVQEVALELEPAAVRVEAGRVFTDAFVVKTADGSFRIRGGASLTGTRDVDVTGAGQLELRALSPFLTDTALAGLADADVRVRGTIDAPRPEGTLQVRDGTLRVRTLPQALGGINARVVFDGTTVRLEDAHATLGGGDLALSGQARLAGTKVADTRVAIKGSDMALAYPVGMRTRLDADLALTGGTGAFVLSGTVKATRGLYDLDVALSESLTARVAEPADSSLLRSIALDLRVETPNPVLVRNNLAQLQATGQVTVRGDAQSPAPIGTLEIAAGGKVFLQGREFVIQSGRLTYRGTWDPALALTATSAKPIPDFDRQTGQPRAQVEVTVSLTGTLEKPGLVLTSTPSYSDRELVNLIASGDSQDPSAREAIGGQAAALLAGRVSRGLRGLGLDEVSIQPELVAREGGVQPGARFTFGKRLTSRVNLVYSLSLQDPEGRFVQLEGTPGRDVTLTVQRDDAGIFTYGAGQRFHRGGPPRPKPPGDERVRLAEVRLEGERPLEPAELLAILGTRPGDRRTIWDLQDRAERLRQRLIDRGYVEAEVAARLDGSTAVFHVRSGPRYRWRIEGLADPPDLDAVLRTSLFEEEALERGRARLLAGLHQRGHIRAVVATRTLREGDARTLLFTVDPGPRLERVEVRFPGASVLGHGALLAAAGGAARLLADPEAARHDVVAAYRQRRYLAAEVGRPQVEDSARTVTITVPIREGPRARVGTVRVTGATLPESELRRVAGLDPGTDFDDAKVAAAADLLRAAYFERGFAGVRINPVVEPRGEALDVVFEVAEGARRTVGQVVVRGLTRTRESLVRRQVRLMPGGPIDPRELVSIERRLLDLGVFARASVEASDEEPSTITVTVAEGDRAIAGYLLRHDGDDGSRADLDGELRNLLGFGLSAGGRYGVGRDLRDARGFLSLPALGRLGRLTASAFRLDEDLPASAAEDPGTPPNVRRQEGAQLQLTRRLGRGWDALVGYRFKRTRLLPLFPDPIDIAGLDVSLLRDTRDSTLDARRGRFWSVSVEYSPAVLGSDFRFIKAFAQAFAMRPLPGSLTWAQGARLGLARGFEGQRLTSTERFRAGGANTIRGFATDAVGPRDGFGDPTGGQAVVVVNEELRYHHRSGLGAAVFYDGGNVFASVSDVSLDWRHAFGVGLRWASPVGLLRFDLGLPVAPRAGEKRYQYFFSLGQAF